MTLRFGTFGCALAAWMLMTGVAVAQTSVN